MWKKYFVLAVLAVSVSCGGDNITGSWVEPVPGQEDSMQGIKLEKGGKASSINMHTLLYEAWEEKDGYLILSGKSVGNRQAIEFSDTLKIEILTPDNLVLSRGSYSVSYMRSRR